MADNTLLNPGTGGDTIATDDVSGVKYQRVKLVDGTLDSTAAIAGDATNGLDVDVTRMPATAADGNTGLPATTVVVSGFDGTNVQAIVTDSTGRPTVNINGTVPVSGPLTDAQLRATAVPISGPLTDTQLRATAVPVSNATLPLPAGASTSAKQPALGTAGTASADVITVQGIASMTALKVDGSGVTQPVSGTVTASGPLTDAQLRNTAVPVSGTVTANAGTGPFPVSDNGGSLTVDGAVGITGTAAVSLATAPALVTGTASIGKVGLDPQTAGGLTPSVTISAASTNATSVKASAGQLYGLYCSNVNAAVRYLKIYNKASAPTVGTDVPVLVFAIPGNTAGAGFTVEFTNGVALGTGIAFAITTGVANSDTGAVAANELVVNLGYK